MKKEWLVKTLEISIIVLFISVSFQPIIAEEIVSVEKISDYGNVDFEEAKEYLFQTIIDISNNPEVNQFLNEHKHSFIPKKNNNYDYKNAIQKIRLENPKLLNSILFTKPKMTFEYFEKNYNKGLEIEKILGKEESEKMIESFNITNSELLNELKNIILDDKQLSNQITILEEMNNIVKSNLDFWTFPIICGIIHIILLPAIIDAGLWLLGLLFFLQVNLYIFCV